jgi:hypothetical protein
VPRISATPNQHIKTLETSGTLVGDHTVETYSHTDFAACWEFCYFLLVVFFSGGGGGGGGGGSGRSDNDGLFPIYVS